MEALPSYASSKVLFVSHNVGSSLLRVNAISLVSIASYIVSALLLRYLQLAARKRSIHGSHGQQSALSELLLRLYGNANQGKKDLSLVVALEAAIFILPLLLSITWQSSTYGSIALSLALLTLAGGPLLYYIRRWEQAPPPRSARKAASDEEDEQLQTTSTIRSASAYHPDGSAMRSRRGGPSTTSNPSTQSEDAASLPSRRKKTYSDSDDEELELEALDRAEQEQNQPFDFDDSSIRVSVESGAEQAWKAANAPESWQGPPNGGATSTASIRPTRRHDHFLTIYRSHMMLITIACILAVDFPIFDRVLGKCETWGASLMDLGVGSFVFALGVVSAGPYLNPRATRPSLLVSLQKDLFKSLPLFALGMIRVVSVKMTSYPEHVSEYGVHWNFFLTLACLPLLKTGIEAMRRVVGGRWSTWGFAIGIVHQIALSFTPLQGYVLSETPRTDSLFSANREGIVSLPGYLGIFLLSIDLGLYILPEQDPYQAFRKVDISKKSSSPLEENPATFGHQRLNSDGRVDFKAIRMQQRRSEVKRLSSLTAILASWAIIYWVLHYFTAAIMQFSHRNSSLLILTEQARRAGVGHFSLTISRRLANLPYILWVSAFNASFILGYALVYWQIVLPVKYLQLEEQQERRSAEELVLLPLTPRLFDLINDHSFALFLLANLLTGAVNMSVQTMYASDSKAMIILGGYMMACCGLLVWVIPVVGNMSAVRWLVGGRRRR